MGRGAVCRKKEGEMERGSGYACRTRRGREGRAAWEKGEREGRKKEKKRGSGRAGDRGEERENKRREKKEESVRVRGRGIQIREKEKEKMKREKMSGTFVPLWVVGRRWGNLLLANSVVTCGRIKFSYFLNPQLI
jgi:hypothetical protein